MRRHAYLFRTDGILSSLLSDVRDSYFEYATGVMSPHVREMFINGHPIVYINFPQFGASKGWQQNIHVQGRRDLSQGLVSRTIFGRRILPVAECDVNNIREAISAGLSERFSLGEISFVFVSRTSSSDYEASLPASPVAREMVISRRAAMNKFDWCTHLLARDNGDEWP